MKKVLFGTLIALMALAQQVFAGDIINNTNCDIRVTALVYNSGSCGVVLTCMSVNVPAHSSAPLPMCVAGTPDLLGYQVCWTDVICATIPCATIGNSSGPYPCAQFPAGPVFLPNCGACSPTISPVRIEWLRATVDANLVVG